MHPELAILLEIQDLRLQRKELLASGQSSSVEEHFQIDVAEAVEQIDERVEELVEQLSSRTAARYRRIRESRERVLVPVIGGICYGCFVSIPTATQRGSEPHSELLSCDHCGRFLYILP